ncbi:MAG: hypothetical protein IAE87_03380 [Rhodobacteraceae bacterium]|jgi:hypothetical protein|nr:hypothetical protein [Paracoccaceae bacterium]
MWADPNLRDFHKRLRRIEKARARGFGFEAPGTLGRSARWGRRNPLKTLLVRLIVLVGLAFLTKGALYFHVGAETYDARVAGLAAGTGFDPMAAQVMAADPVTKTIAALLAQVFPQAA